MSILEMTKLMARESNRKSKNELYTEEHNVEDVKTDTTPNNQLNPDTKLARMYSAIAKDKEELRELSIQVRDSKIAYDVISEQYESSEISEQVLMENGVRMAATLLQRYQTKLNAAQNQIRSKEFEVTQMQQEVFALTSSLDQMTEQTASIEFESQRLLMEAEQLKRAAESRVANHQKSIDSLREEIRALGGTPS